MSATRFDLTNGVATITLDRPDKLNAFSTEMAAELQDAWTRCDDDDDVRVVVLTGQGRAFCAGADFSDGAAVFAAPSQDEQKPPFSADPFRVHAWDVRKPVIAAINGPAIGIGLTMTLQCDLRYVAEDAKLGIVQVRRGVMPDARSHWSLPRLIGHARAAEILMTGRMFSGAEAADWGLANEALSADAVLDRAMEVARDIATNTAPVSVGVTKRLLWRDPQGRSADIERLETELHQHLMAGPDASEGVMAFMEKRDPQWSMNLSDDWPEWLD